MTGKTCLKKEFQNVAADCWLYTSGGLGRKQPCICLRGNSDGATVLLRAVAELSHDTPPSKRKLSFKSNRKNGFSSLQFRFVPASAELQKLFVAIEKGELVVEFTPTGAVELTSALETWIHGGEDFCLYPEGKKSDLGNKDRASGELWFWVTMYP